jgi:ElaB/YqjD/DUF883 family membrane-anchored ribosome-binding protein
MTEETETTGTAASEDAVCSAAEALRRARAELKTAQAFYKQVRQQAAERLEAIRRTSIGDVLDCSLKAVKRHPAAGLTIAALIGFYLGRLFRR